MEFLRSPLWMRLDAGGPGIPPAPHLCTPAPRVDTDPSRTRVTRESPSGPSDTGHTWGMSFLDRFRRGAGVRMSRPARDARHTGSTRVRAADETDIAHL